MFKVIAYGIWTSLKSTTQTTQAGDMSDRTYSRWQTRKLPTPKHQITPQITFFADETPIVQQSIYIVIRSKTMMGIQA
jgi:hypothetical protein